jgi:peptidoglycan/LPS O-acetylase OafA/YrhL
MRATQFTTGFKYRADIDGLRALAILPVVLFHFRIPYFTGGFVGVDVFFVISGYLITSLVAGEMASGTFSIARFYERRVRRIFPALFAMLALVTAAACVLLFPFDLIRYARSLCATALFAANFEFWQETGYFDVSADQKPLLHLWSIAVEEQFYLLFPAILLLMGNRRRLRMAGVIGILLASFAFSVWAAVHAKTAGFYLLPSRAWELMLGAVFALNAVPAIRSKPLREAAGVSGIALIGTAIFALSPDAPFPGAYALLPCAGAALIIHSGRSDDTLVRRVLALRPLVFIGLISYSLYLWHWPVFVFAKYVLFRELSLAERCLLIAVSFVLAILSWRFVEQPLRRPVRRRRLFPAAAAAIAAAFSCGAFAVASAGLPQRLSPRLQQILAEQDDHEPGIDHCFALTADDVKKGRLCTIGAAKGSQSFLLWGDSHADAILPAVAAIARGAGRTGLFAGGASCVPLVGVTTPTATCKPFNDAVEKVALGANITEVILEARWAKYADGEPYGDEPHGHVVITDSESQDPPPADNHAVFDRGLERTVRALTAAGKKVVLVASVPEIGYPVPAVLARRALAGQALDLAPGMDVYLQRQHFVLETFARIQKLYGVTVIYPPEVLCTNGRCAVALNGIPLYRDEHHLSVYGALKLAPLLAGTL